MRAGKLIVAFVVASVASHTIAHAGTVSEYISKQSELENLDYRLERYDRLIKIKEAEAELEGAGRASLPSTAPARPVQYFGPNGEPIDQPQSASDTDEQRLLERQRLSEEEEKRQAKARERDAELSMLNDAKIVEVFRNAGPGSTYGAVLEIGGGRTEVQAGDAISSWTVTRVSLDQITLTNTKYGGAVRHIKQYR